MSPPAVVAGGSVAAPAMAMAATVAVPEGYAREAILAWYRGEFAAANAIIDALCTHLVEIADGAPEYEAVFAAIHRRRMNWVPVLHMQKYYSIADVTAELLHATETKRAAMEVNEERSRASIVEEEPLKEVEDVRTGSTAEISHHEAGAEATATATVTVAVAGDLSRDSNVVGDGGASDEGSQGGKTSQESNQISTDHEVSMIRPERIKISKGFMSKEMVKGHMVNVVKGLKLYEDIFTESELLKLSEFINELRLAGHNGELSGETFIFFNKQVKGNKREIIQLGIPLFQPIKQDASSTIEPIPEVLQTVIDHLVQWRLIPEGRKPNSCIINFFDEDEFSQPYFKPPHLDNPISTLLLSDTTMAFGRVLACDHNGNYKGSFTLPLKEGSLLVMRGNSADMARHVICPSSNRRVTITFVKVRSPNNQNDTPVMPTTPTKAMTLWQPGVVQQEEVPNGGATIGYGSQGLISAWGMTLRAPVIMFAPPKPVIMNPSRKVSRHGTGVFLPWTVGPKKYIRHLPPRIQKRRLPALPSPMESQVNKIPQIPTVMV
ncbi:Clavaminate synthase-like protein [Dioscorea alata]|uniref:Clavaminate synthase-like protein n=1 Tax=Dioscorea alata TaxID=55571 RepID=A0ACB7VQR4_DIOAL|nr:Clavaminate synthase-like protein [Dioscorea alata]